MDCLCYPWVICLSYIKTAMKKNPFVHEDSQVLVLGFGITGRAAVRYLIELGAHVYVSDIRTKETLAEEERAVLQELCRGFELGGHTLEFLDGKDMLFVSPGISLNHEIVQEARSRNIPVMGELALAAPVLDSQVIAVTGTNGKTTVTTLLGKVFTAAGRDVFVGGNIGTPILQCLTEERTPEVMVLEISSFQLEFMGDFKPDIAILLNITPDHIDWHGSMFAYISAKSRIFANQNSEDVAIICGDNMLCKELADHLERQPATFGHDRACTAYICENEVYLRLPEGVEHYILSGCCSTFSGQLNSAAVILAARKGGCSREVVAGEIQAFTGLPHRMEEVAEIDSIVYCNDSKATNTGAAMNALKQARGSVVLIAGGKEKGEDYSNMRDVVKKKVHAAVLLGEAAAEMGRVFSDITRIEYAGTMEEAVKQARHLAIPGGTVLLAPACASFDMFANYGARGDAFKAAVLQLSERQPR